MYFIIRAKEWYVCTIRGTFKELESFLASIGSKIVEEQEVYHEDLRLVYRKRIVTETNALGYNESLYDELYSELSSRLSSINKRAFAINEDRLEMALHDICSDVPIKTDRIDILVSDGEEYQLPPNHYCTRRTFFKFSDIDLPSFCRFVRDHAYVDIMLNEQEGDV